MVLMELQICEDVDKDQFETRMEQNLDLEEVDWMLESRPQLRVTWAREAPREQGTYVCC